MKNCCRMLFLVVCFVVCISAKVEVRANSSKIVEEEVDFSEEFMSREWTNREILAVIYLILFGLVIIALIIYLISMNIIDKKMTEITLRRHDRLIEMYRIVFSNNKKDDK